MDNITGGKMHATTDLFLVGWANVETCHHNGCSWHQVEFGVGGAIVRRPNKIAGEKTRTGTS